MSQPAVEQTDKRFTSRATPPSKQVERKSQSDLFTQFSSPAEKTRPPKSKSTTVNALIAKDTKTKFASTTPSAIEVPESVIPASVKITRSATQATQGLPSTGSSPRATTSTVSALSTDKDTQAQRTLGSAPRNVLSYKDQFHISQPRPLGLLVPLDAAEM